MKSQVIKEGVIDSGYIATLEAQAAGGGAGAVTRAALAHLAAGEFELSQHEADKAVEHFEAMELFSGRQRELVLASLTGRAYALLMKSEFSAALEQIARARKITPQSQELAALSGWTHYRLNQMDAAIADLEFAQRIRPSPRVADLLERANRDKGAEDDLGRRFAPFCYSLSRRRKPAAGFRSNSHSRGPVPELRKRTSLRAGRAYRRHPVHPRNISRRHSRAGLGRRTERRADSRSGTRNGICFRTACEESQTRIDT